MATRKQILANRRNAVSSAGPRTPSGMKNSSMNALKHGMCAKNILIIEESAKEFEKFQQGIHDDLKPSGALEKALVRRIIAALWRLQRTDRAEAGIFNVQLLHIHHDETDRLDMLISHRMGMVFTNDIYKSNAMDKIRRYQTSLERGMYRALAELRTLQAARLEQQADSQKSESSKPKKIASTRQTALAHKKPLQEGEAERPLPQGRRVVRQRSAGLPAPDKVAGEGACIRGSKPRPDDEKSAQKRPSKTSTRTAKPDDNKAENNNAPRQLGSFRKNRKIKKKQAV